MQVQELLPSLPISSCLPALSVMSRSAFGVAIGAAVVFHGRVRTTEDLPESTTEGRNEGEARRAVPESCSLVGARTKQRVRRGDGRDLILGDNCLDSMPTPKSGGGAWRRWIEA